MNPPAPADGGSSVPDRGHGHHGYGGYQQTVGTTDSSGGGATSDTGVDRGHGHHGYGGYHQTPGTVHQSVTQQPDPGTGTSVDGGYAGDGGSGGGSDGGSSGDGGSGGGSGDGGGGGGGGDGGGGGS